MLPKTQYLAYKDLLKEIQDLYSYTNLTNLDTTILSSKFQSVQQIFNDRIMPSIGNNLEHQDSYRTQSLQTELHRCLRLLATDLMLLRSAKQSQTLTPRLATVQQRIQQAMSYCQDLIN